MTQEMKSIVIIGSGTMGSGIAAVMANAGCNVTMLDVLPNNTEENRSSLAQKAIDKMRERPYQYFTSPDNSARISVGNVEDNISKVAEADWVIEVVTENLEIKHELYKKIETYASEKTIVSSNTSTFTLQNLTRNITSDLKNRFFITHFFNPPRYLPLLEFVAPDQAHAASKNALSKFCSEELGRVVVPCNDVPGFIANRIGCAWLAIFLYEVEKHHLSISMVDSIVSKLMGIPKTGIFGLIDLIGVDIFTMIMQSLTSTLPKTDPLFQMAGPSLVLDELIQRKWLGNKTKIGFYRTNENNDKLELDVSNYAHQAVPKHKMTQEITIEDIFQASEGPNLVIRDAIAKTLLYACHVMPEATTSALMVDTAMCSGYNWKQGPFRLIDSIAQKLSPDWLCQEADRLGLNDTIQPVARAFYKDDTHCLSASGRYIKIPDNIMQYDIDYLRTTDALLLANDSAALVDIKDNVACFAIVNKDRTIDDALLTLLEQSLEYVEAHNYSGMVIYGVDNFCRGANVKIFAEKTKAGDYKYIKDIIQHGTKVFSKLKHAKIPVVAAITGFALGGGCELAMHCSSAVVHSNAKIGLVEPGIGLIPGWGGCREMIYRVSKNNIALTLGQILDAKVSSSAEEARQMLYITANDTIVMGQHMLLQKAKEKALASSKTYIPKPMEHFCRGIPSYVNIMDKFREQHHYSSPVDNIAKGFIEVCSSMNNFESVQAKVFIDLLSTKYAQQKIDEIIKH